MKEKNSTQRLVMLALLIALNVILGRLSIQLIPEVRLSVFGFIPIALAGTLMGPGAGAAAGAIGDILNYLLFTHAYGGYFPGYTLTAALSGLWYGYVLHRRNFSFSRCALTIVPVILLGEMLLNSLWVYIMYSKTFWANLPMRLVTNVVECPVKIFLLMGMGKLLHRVSPSQIKL